MQPTTFVVSFHAVPAFAGIKSTPQRTAAFSPSNPLHGDTVQLRFGASGHTLRELGKTLKADPRNEAGQNALKQLVDCLFDTKTEMREGAELELCKALKSPDAWRAIQNTMTALIKEDEEKRYAFTRIVAWAGDYQHTWPDILNGLDANHSVGLRQLWLHALDAAVENNPAIWSQAEAKVLECLKDPNFEIQSTALSVLSSATQHRTLALRVLPYVNDYVETFKSTREPRIQEVEKQLWEARNLSDKEQKLLPFVLETSEILDPLHKAYMNLAGIPGSWATIEPFVSKIYSGLLTGKSTHDRTLRTYWQTIFAAAQHPQNWNENKGNIKSYFEWALKDEFRIITVPHAISLYGIDYHDSGKSYLTKSGKAFRQSTFLWHKLKPTFIAWINQLPKNLEKDCHKAPYSLSIDWSAAMDLLGTIKRFLKFHPQDWQEFEKPITDLWQSQMKAVRNPKELSSAVSVLRTLQREMPNLLPNIANETTPLGDLFRETRKLLRFYDEENDRFWFEFSEWQKQQKIKDPV